MIERISTTLYDYALKVRELRTEDAEVFALRDTPVVAEHGVYCACKWPGAEGNVYLWWEIEGGKGVGLDDTDNTESFIVCDLPRGYNATLYIKLPNINHNNFGLELMNAAEYKIEHFDSIAHQELWTNRTDDPRHDEKQAWGTFWQGRDHRWLYLEFWMKQSLENWAKLVHKALEIGKKLGVEVRLGSPTGELITVEHANTLPEFNLRY